jgi:tRNA A-37 threonylcarbamoyl transferase component Bud32
VLVCRRAGALEFVLVDLVGVRVGVRGGTPERALLGWLVGIERELTGVEKLELIRGSVVFEGSDSEVLRRWQRAMDRKRAEFRRRWPGRRARLLKTSSLCVRTRVDGGVLYLRRPFDRDTALAVLRAWKESEIPERDVLKQGAKRSLCRVRVDGRAYVLKAYLQPRRWDRLRPERRTWLNAYHLEALQLPVVPCLAWFAAADGTGVLVFEDGGERDLYWEMRYNRSADERRRLLRAAARLFAWTHAAGVRHGDFKATNVLVTSEPGRMPLGLVDTDQVRFDQRIGLRARLHNLNQFLGRATHDVTPFEIGRFLVWYARDACLERRELRWLRERIHLEDFQPPPDRHGGSPS